MDNIVWLMIGYIIGSVIYMALLATGVIDKLIDRFYK